jgi:uncharacterized membrane protein
MQDLEEAVKVFTLLIATIIEGFSSIIIAHALIIATGQYFKASVKFRIDKTELRLKLGKSLAVALEFLLAADILRTAILPSWDDIGKLAAIAALRTVLNVFLERELRTEEK